METTANGFIEFIMARYKLNKTQAVDKAAEMSGYKPRALWTILGNEAKGKPIPPHNQKFFQLLMKECK